MTAQQPLESLEIKGYASIRETRVDLTSDVTLLVGANGSGKSNVVGAFELLGRIVDQQLNDHLIRTLGGLSSVLHAAPNSADDADRVSLEAWGRAHNSLSNGYRAVVEPAAGDAATLDERSSFQDRSHYTSPHHDHLGTARESVLRDLAETSAKERFVLEVMSGCRVFHFDDTSIDAPPKKRTDVADDLTLGPNAHNLAPLLSRIRASDPPRYTRIVRTVRSVAPFFDDFVLEPEYGKLLLRWRERGLDRVFSADALSDGTLRFVCLAVLLLQPSPPATIVLDEPELGLHPFAIHQLAGLLRVAGRQSRVVAATQSVTLLSEFSLEEVAVVERSGRGTIVNRPDVGSLQRWLDDYSLGTMWEKNLLGGRPRPDNSPSENVR